MKRIFFSIFIFSFLSISAHADVVIIIHGKDKTDKIDLKTIMDIYTGKKTEWSDNTKIIFATLEEGSENETFMRVCVHKSSIQFGNFWRQQLFLGKIARMPKKCSSMEEMIKFVESTPGSIGYVPSGQDISGENVKQILTVR